MPISTEFKALHAVQAVCSSSNALEAHIEFKRNIDLLQDWQIIFADMENVGSIKLLNLPLGDSGLAASVFRGNSLWLMDAKFVAKGDAAFAEFRCGTSLFLDSNAASYIRALAYQSDPRPEVLKAAKLMSQLGGKLGHLNFYLYLWEAQLHWTPETIKRCKETIAAVHALSTSGSNLTVEWGKRYRETFREQSEGMANAILDDFEKQLENGLSTEISQQLDILEAMLIRTQIIELSSKKSPEHKLSVLATFMHEELSTMMLRELIVCGDILKRSKNSGIANKLNALQNQSNPAAVLRNCAWDLYIPRALDTLCAAKPEQEQQLDFYLAEMLTFDGDVSDILRTTQLRALAVHRPTMRSMPFFDNEIAGWLGNRIGDKRMDSVKKLFLPEAFEERAKRRSIEQVRNVLQSDREQLLQMLRTLKN